MDQYQGTKAPSAAHAFDVQALQAYLQRELPGFAGPLAVEQFKGGQSNPTYKLVTPTAAYVMRSKPGPVAKLLPSAHAIEREYRVMAALAGSGVPVPKMLLQCGDESVIGRAFYLMELVEGRVLWEQSLPGMAREQRAAIYDEMNRVIAALHRLDVGALGLADYGRPGNYFQRQIDRWIKQYRGAETETIPAMERLIAELPARIPVSDEVSIAHGDYRLENVMFHPTEPRIIAVLDWELSTLGHPLADVAYGCILYHSTSE
ncbi:MAG TPA: phosphotransferase family protein, partial [Rubrivivax sp.]|nr:phosphotransferase family protein [Rubrivivax sp.]